MLGLFAQSDKSDCAAKPQSLTIHYYLFTNTKPRLSGVLC